MSDAEFRFAVGKEGGEVVAVAVFAAAAAAAEVIGLQPEAVAAAEAEVMGLQLVDGREDGFLSPGGSDSEGKVSVGTVDALLAVFVLDAKDFSISEAGVDCSWPQFVVVFLVARSFKLGDSEE